MEYPPSTTAPKTVFDQLADLQYAIKADLELRQKYSHLFEKLIQTDLLELIKSNCHLALRYRSDINAFKR